MIRIAVVEDEAQYQKMLCSYVERFAREHTVELQTEIFADGMDLVED